MKKTLFLIFCVVASSLMVQGAELLFELNQSVVTGALSLNLGNSSFNSDGVLNVQSSTSLANRPSVDLSSTGTNLYNGFTISLEVAGAGANGNLFGLASGGTDFLFAAGTNRSSQGLFMFNGSSNNAGNTGNSTVLGVTSSTPSIITITTGWNGSEVAFKMYENGSLVASGKTTNTELTQQELSLLALGGWAGSSSNSTTGENIYRLAIYDGVMTEKEVLSAYQAWTPVVPEPATAALGVLGLGTLLLRRRRQH